MAIYDRAEELNGGGSATEQAALKRAMNALSELPHIEDGDRPKSA